MSLNNDFSPADFAAMSGNNGFGGANSEFWFLILFLCIFSGGWGNNWGGGFGGNTGTPYVVADVQNGFDQAAVMGSLNGITSALSNGFANAEISRCNQQTNILQTLNNMGMTQQQSDSNIRADIAALAYNVATEACADRSAVNDALQAVTAQNNANTQRILDMMYQDKLDAKNEEIANLRTQINLAALGASQNAQTAQILADNAAQTAQLERYLGPVAPVPAYIVQNPNGCGCGNVYGCGCGA